MHEVLEPAVGRVHSISSIEPREGYLWLQQIERAGSGRVIVLSRLSPQRLDQLMPLATIEHRWLTEKEDESALEPTLERLHQFIINEMAEGAGHIWLDATEYLVSMHGFDSTLSFIRSVADAAAGGAWSLLLPFSPLVFDSTQIARLRREAPEFEVETPAVISQEPEEAPQPDAEESVTGREAESGREPEDEVVSTLGVEVEKGLVMLSRIPESSLSRAVLQRRIEQWQSMGFDVSDLLPSLVMERGARYTQYCEYEEKVRRAVECERRIRELKTLGFTTEVTKLRFRVMQLTGLDDVEAILTHLLAEAR